LALADLNSAIRLDKEAVKPPPGWLRSWRWPSDLAREYGFRGGIYEKKGDFPRAISDTNEAIRSDPDNPLCWLSLASQLRKTGECEKGMAAIAKIFDSGRVDLLALLERGDLYRCLGDVERALSDYKEAARLSPENGLCWLSLANLFKETQQYEKAIDALSRALEKQPGNLPARILRADIYRLQRANEKAMADASEAVRLHPDRAEAYTARASAYNAAKQYEDAIADANRAIEINPRDFDACLQRGFAYLQLHKYEQAVGDVTEGIELLTSAPGIKLTSADARIFNSVAWLLVTCPDPTVRDRGHATEYIDRALQLAPDQWQSWDTRAAVFAENGDFENAVSWEERCLQRNDLSEEQRRGASERLALYRAGKPYREEPK